MDLNDIIEIKSKMSVFLGSGSIVYTIFNKESPNFEMGHVTIALRHLQLIKEYVHLSSYDNMYKKAIKNGLTDKDVIANIEEFAPYFKCSNKSSFERRGIGSHILDYVLKDLKELGVKLIWAREVINPVFEKMLLKRDCFVPQSYRNI